MSRQTGDEPPGTPRRLAELRHHRIRHRVGKPVPGRAAKETNLTVPDLAHELGWTVARTEELRGLTHQRPVLRLVP
ncbi:hypothetical protein [Micromonospora sp. KC723]|uniref:hypothetical protein n=1 Tax=Micromonospora sp. KC723 TaxID=2530381 RepID=UPI00104EAD14|nr:hypothetical protein [Micromonospora sp. KC723]TDB74405.1 hypothetical protein E1165_14625 [Micromonospora sp. KC723]